MYAAGADVSYNMVVINYTEHAIYIKFMLLIVYHQIHRWRKTVGVGGGH